MAKYRTHKVKHEHSMIPGLQIHLERIAACPDIHGIIPGPIRPVRSAARGLTLVIQYEIETGLRCLAKTAQAVQEVRIVTGRPAAVRRWLVERELAEDRLPPAPPAPPPPRKGPGTPGKQVVLQFDQRCAACGRTVAAGSRAVRIGTPPDCQYFHVRCFREGNP